MENSTELPKIQAQGVLPRFRGQLSQGYGSPRFTRTVLRGRNESRYPAGSRPLRTGSGKLDLGLLGDLQRVVYLNPEVANGAFELGMAEE